MPKRKRMNRRRSKALFKRTAARTHRRNIPASTMRGGYRL